MTDSQIAAVAGEYFVAYRIVTLGIVTTFVRQGMQGIDLLASSSDGKKTVAVIVKSASSAICETGPHTEGGTAQLRFPLGLRAIRATADMAFFCFVDLKKSTASDSPEVYVVPARVLKKEYERVHVRKYSAFGHCRSISEMEPYRNNWQPLIDALTLEDGEVLDEVETRASGDSSRSSAPPDGVANDSEYAVYERNKSTPPDIPVVGITRRLPVLSG